jgi:hypothetical protein
MADLKEKYADKKKKKKKKEMTESEKMPHGMSALKSVSKKKILPRKKISPKKKVYKKILKLRRVKPELVKPKRVKKAPKIAKDKKSIKYRVDDPDYVRKEKSFYREERLRNIGAKVGLALAAAVAAPKRKFEKRKVPDKKISAGKAAARKAFGAVSIAASLSAVAGEIAGGVETLSFKIKEKRRRRLLEKMKERDKKNLKKK